MSESTVTKSKVFKEDLQLATGGTGAAEEGTRITSTGGEATLTKLDASHIMFRTIAKSLDDLVDGGNDITLKPNSLTMAGTLTLSAQTTAGFVKNTAAGVISGGNSLVANDIPSGISATVIADGSVSNTEFQYLNGVTSAIQTQLNSATTPASQADQETGTEAAKYVAPATQQFHPSAPKAWVRFTVSGGTVTVQSSYNVTGVTRNAINDFTITFSTAFANTAYAVVPGFCGIFPSIVIFATVFEITRAVGTCQITLARVSDASMKESAQETPEVNVMFFGDQ